MGKWSWLKDKIPSAPADPSYEDALAILTEEYKSLSLKARADIFTEIEDKLAELARQESELTTQRSALTRSLVLFLENEDMDSVTVGGYRFSQKPEPYAQITDKAAFKAWAFEEMRDNLTVHPSTLNATVKAALETGETLPPGVEVFLKQGISRTKSAK